MIRAITLHQPWATLMALGHKKIETRSWKTNYHGGLAIHSAATIPAYARKFMELPEIQELIHGHELPLGKILGVCTLVKCLPVEALSVELGPMLGPTELLLGDYTPGRFGLLTSHMVAAEPPIPAIGKQRLWKWED